MKLGVLNKEIDLKVCMENRIGGWISLNRRIYLCNLEDYFDIPIGVEKVWLHILRRPREDYVPVVIDGYEMVEFNGFETDKILSLITLASVFKVNSVKMTTIYVKVEYE